MKAIPHTVAATKQARGFSHRCALEIEFDGGSRCYTSDDWNPGLDSPLRDRVMSWGGMSAMLEASDPSVFAQADFSVTIGDPDGELRDLWEDEQFQKRKCSLYWAVFVPGEAEPTYRQSVLILRGILVPPVTWREGDRAITLAITDVSQENETLVGARCTRDDFPWISEENEGREVPIVYGHVDRLSPTLLNRGPLAKVVRGFSPTATTFMVDDAEGFPQGENIFIEIGEEVIEGQFDGNIFTVASRGVNLIASTTTNPSTGGCTLIDTGLAAMSFPDNRFVGYLLKITVTLDPLSAWSFQHRYTQLESIATLRAYAMTVGPDQSRQVIRIIKAQNMLEWRTPLIVEQAVIDDGITTYDIDGAQLAVPAGVNYAVGTNADAHGSGDDVLRYLGDDTSLQYAVAMGACTVRQVYVHGRQYKPRTLYLGQITNYVGSIGTLKSALTNWLDKYHTEARDSWIPLRPDLYSVDTITAEGRTITRLNLVRYPTQLGDYICTRDDILVDVSGPTGGDGGVIVNPAEVIEDLFASSGKIASVRGCGMWLKMDEDSGRVAADASGNGNDGTLYGDTEFRPDAGKIDGAIDFPGAAGDEVRVVNSTSLRSACAGQFSVSLWTRCEGPAPPNMLHVPLLNKKTTYFVGDGFCFYGVYTVGRIEIWGDGGNAAITSDDIIDWTDGEWHHVVVIFDNTAISVYVDGAEVTMVDATIAGVTANDLDLLIGRLYITGGDRYLNGYIDDVRIYDRLLSVAEIGALATPQRGDSDFSVPRSRLTNWRMNFARPELVPLRAITADLAMQSRCRIRWLGDSPELLYQGVDGGEEDLAVDAQHVILNSAVSGRDELEMAASRVTASWTEDGKTKSVSAIDADVEAEIGQRERKVNCWAYDDIECPRILARWFLHCYKTLHDRASFAATVHGVGLEPGDVVAIGADLDDEFAFGAPTKGRVYETTHDPGTEPDALPREDVGMRMFRWAGCDNSCEGSCETTGCETVCESYWEPDSTCWTCETSCQTICEHFCETGGQLFCSDHACETALVVGCAVSCQMAEIAGGPPCGACETTCQCLCTTGACQASDPYSETPP